MTGVTCGAETVYHSVSSEFISVFSVVRFVQSLVSYAYHCLSLCTFLSAIERLEDTKEVIRSCISKKVRQHNEQKTKDKGQTTIYKTLHRKLTIEHQELH